MLNVKGSTTRLLAHVSFWLATLVIVMMGWTLYVASKNEAESSRRVSHSQSARQKLVGVEALIQRGESAHRGFLLSAVEAFPVEREKVFTMLDKAIASVQKLTQENPIQQQRLGELGTLIAARRANMRDNELLRRADAMDAAQIQVASNLGRQATKQMVELTRALKREERSMLRDHRAAAAHRHDTEMGVLIAAVVFGLIVLIPGYLGFVLQSRARRQTEKQLRVMADSLPGAMYQVRHTTRGPSRVVFMSAAIASISKKVTTDWTSLLEDIDQRDRQEVDSALAKSKTTFAPFRQSYRVRHADGTTQFVHHEATLHKQSDGSILQNGYMADCSEQKRLEEALVAAKESADEANRAKSVFLATMSHEIRTPMNGALGMLELLSFTRLDAEQRTTLSIVRESSKSLLRLIDDILDFSMIEAEKLELRPEVVSIRDVIEGVRNIYSGVASSKGLSILRSTDPKISPAVRVDPLRLRQILNNLVSNALKFTREGHVEIKAEWIARDNGEDRVRFSVSDTGIGISPENQRRLFQPFSRGEPATHQFGGTGLGLTICRRLATLMGGSVAMVSELGVGTTMTLDLSMPIAEPVELPSADPEIAHDRLIAVARSRRSAPGTEEAVRDGTLVLIVDDHPTNRMLLMRQAHTLGYAALSADNGVEALALWQSKPFALLITDCNMPDMDGYALTKAIRRIESERINAHMPVIACTANALGGQVEKCLAAGMDDCMVKPVDLAQLLRKLDRWLPLPASEPTARAQAAEPQQLEDSARAHVVIERSALAEISGGDAAVEHSILNAFRDANDSDVVLLERALLDHDQIKVARTAHRMSGASRMIGAHGFASVCEGIERAAQGGDWAAIAADKVALHRELKCLNNYLVSI